MRTKRPCKKCNIQVAQVDRLCFGCSDEEALAWEWRQEQKTSTYRDPAFAHRF